MTLTGALVAAIAVFMLPGFIVSWVAGAKIPAAAASALPVTFGMMGMSAWMWGETTAPFNWVTFTISVLFTLGCAVLWRWFVARRQGRADIPAASWRERLFPSAWRSGGIADPAWILPAAGVGLGAWMLVGDRLRWLQRVPHGVDNIVQGWDVQWHANVVRFIMDEGIASPTRMGELRHIEHLGHLFYPTGFHAAAALYGQAAVLEPIAALNLATAIVPSIALPLSLACLVFAAMGSRGLTAQIAAALAAVSAYGVPTLMWVPDYVGVWPYLTAVSLTGIVIWQFWTVPAQPFAAFPTALGFLGILVIHPSAITIVALAVALYWLTRLLFVPNSGRIRDTLWLAAPAVVGGMLYLPQVLEASTQAEEVSSVAPPDDDVDPAGAWATILMMRTRHSVQFFPQFDATLLLWLAGIGAVALIVWRRRIWPVLFFALSALIAVNVLEPFGGWLQDTLEIISSMHYSTAHRLVMPVTMMTLCGAGIGAAVTIRVLTLAPLAARTGSRMMLRGTAAASIAVAAAAGAGTFWWAKDAAAEGAEQSYSASRVDDRMVNDADLMAFDWLATQPAAWEGLTFGDHFDGYSWMYAYNGVPTLARHYQWASGGRGSDMDALYWHANELGEGLRGAESTHNPVDEAARELGVRFIVSSPGSFWADQLQPHPMTKGLWTSKGATPVYRKSGTVVFAVTDAFTRSELYQMRMDAQRAGSDPLVDLKDTQ